MTNARLAILAALTSAAAPAHATMPVLLPASVPGIGLFGVIATGVAAALIAWWRMRK